MIKTRRLILIIILINALVVIGMADYPSQTEVPTQPILTIPTPTMPTPVQTVNSQTSMITSLASSIVLSVSLSNLDPNPPIVGENVEIRIGIENIGGTTASNIKMEIVPEYPFELVTGENAIKNVGIIEGYETDSTANIKIVKYKLKINKDASSRIYEIKVKYYEEGSNSKIENSLFIDVKSRDNAEVIHIDKTILIPGKQSSLKFRINNVGNAPLRDIIFNWENKDSVILPVGSDNTKYIKYIDTNESYDLEYQVIADTNAKTGLYKLDLYLNYLDNIDGTMKKLSTIAGVYVGGGTDFDISYAENADGEVSFNIANTGSNPAYAVLVIIPRQDGWKMKDSNSAMIGNLNSGDYTIASFKFSSDNNSSSHTSNNIPEIVMRIGYTDTMGERKFIDKNVELGQDMVYKDLETPKRQGSTNITFYTVMILILIILVFLMSTYRKYAKQKLVDPDLKILDVFRHKKKKFG